MKKYRRIFTVVLDSLGVGQAPDSPQYGDVGVDTLGHISEKMESFHIPNLQKLGIANLHPLKQVAPTEHPMARFAKLQEKSLGKDTMTGHWEMMGLYITQPFKTFTDTGFPPELIEELEKRTGRKIIGNKSASGTEILDELAEEEINEGHLIVYTSAALEEFCLQQHLTDLGFSDMAVFLPHPTNGQLGFFLLALPEDAAFTPEAF